MKLVSIITTWADTLCLLPKCIENHLQFSDHVIVVWSNSSNIGVRDERILTFITTTPLERTTFMQCEPINTSEKNRLMNETRKRNYGLAMAKEMGFNHYIMADADEFYLPGEVIKAKKSFDGNGIVCRIRVFVGKPTLWCYDLNTVIPFIHRLKKDSLVGKFNEYPLAYKANGQAQIDPSRRPNEIAGVKMSEVECYHMSYVRDDFDMKIKNSTANLMRTAGVIKQDVRLASAGYKSLIYGQTLQSCENHFGI